MPHLPERKSLPGSSQIPQYFYLGRGRGGGVVQDFLLFVLSLLFVIVVVGFVWPFFLARN